MIKRNLITISILMLISVICGILVLNIDTGYDDGKNVSGNIKPLPTAIAEGSESLETVNGNNTPEVIRSEEIRVYNNTSELNFAAQVYENSLNKTLLKFEYSMGSERLTKEYDYGIIPELQNMFQKREGYQGTVRGNRIREVYLNPKFNKAYFLVEGKPGIQGVETAIFSFDYKNLSLTRLMAEEGNFSELSFSNDLRYAAYNYSNLADGNPYLQIIQCENDKLFIKKNKLDKDYLGGNKPGVGMVCGYWLLNWNGNGILKLKEVISPEGIKVTTDDILHKGKEVLYDVDHNIFLNPDGSKVISPVQTNELKVRDSASIKSIKNFYEFIATEKYDKAYDLLDTKFKINAFKEFGVSELSKDDIDVDKFAVYGSFFKMAKLDRIVEEKVEGNNATVYFYQSISTGKGIDIQKPLVARLKKAGNQWRITEVSDGNVHEKPFSVN